MTLPALDGWYAYMASHDKTALWDLLDPDAVFESPVVHTPQRGREIAFKYLSGADQVLGGPEFRYTGEWRNAGGAILEFETEVEGIRINGIDMLAFSDDGQRIVNFKVMIRPFKGLQGVIAKMAELLSAK
jgi:hypothetical protein